MKAMAFSEFGGPEVLLPIELPQPEPGPGQVRIEVRTAGYNPIDMKVRSGAFGDPEGGFPAVLGADVAGVVDAVGQGAAFTVGDEVLGWALTGSYAEYALADKVTLKPADLDWIEASALPVGTEAANRCLEVVALADGETVLIHGAAGLVGAYATQLAVRRGATVIGTAAPATHDYVRSLGAIPVAYGAGWVQRVREAAPQGVDAVVDAVGNGLLPESVELLGGTARIVTIADGAASELGITFSAGTAENQSVDGLAEFARLAAIGELTVTISATFPLARASAAHAFAEAPHASGKIVLLVAE